MRRQSQVLIPVICEDPAMKLGGRHGGVLFSLLADHVFDESALAMGFLEPQSHFLSVSPRD